MKKAMALAACLALLAPAAGSAQRTASSRSNGPSTAAIRAARNTRRSSRSTATRSARLEVAWEWKTGEQPLPQFGTTPGAFENTPIMIDNVLYLSTPYNRVVALDADTGRELWSYDPKAYEEGAPASGQGFVHRGVAAWRDGDKLRIFMNSRYHLICLDAKTGQPVESFGNRRISGRRREPGVADSEEALLEHVAAGRLQGPRHPRERHRRPVDVPERSPRRRAGVQREDRQDGLELPHDPAEGRVRQRDLGARVVGVHRAHQRLGADDARRAARPALHAGRHAEQRLLRRPPPRRESVRRSARLPRCRDRQAEVAFSDRPPRAVGLRPGVAAEPRDDRRSEAGRSTPSCS